MTDVQAVSALIGDPNNVIISAATVAEINAICNVSGEFSPGPQNIGIAGTSVGCAEYFFAASICLRSMAAMVASNLHEVKIGDYQVSQSKQVEAINALADSYYKHYLEVPAYGIIETNESDLNALVIIRNYVLRSNP